MLDEEQLPVRAEDACDLAECALGLVDVQRTSVETTVSTDESGNGRRSAGASTIRPTRACRCRRRASRRRIAGSGSTSTSSAIPSG
jgi:hypothetical protein